MKNDFFLNFLCAVVIADLPIMKIAWKCFEITTGMVTPQWQRNVNRAVKPRFNPLFSLKCPDKSIPLQY